MFIFNLFSTGRGHDTVPIFPLNTVLFPGAILPLRIFEVRYIDMARACMREQSPFGVCLIKEGDEVGTPAVPEAVGCLARIVDCDAQELGILKVRTEGTERFRLASTQTNAQGLILGEIARFDAEPPAPESAGLAECATFLGKAMVGIGTDRFNEPYKFDDASWVSFRLAEILPLRMDVKQKLLELTDASLRIGILHRFLKQQRLI